MQTFNLVSHTVKFVKKKLLMLLYWGVEVNAFVFEGGFCSSKCKKPSREYTLCYSVRNTWRPGTAEVSIQNSSCVRNAFVAELHLFLEGQVSTTGKKSTLLGWEPRAGTVQSKLSACWKMCPCRRNTVWALLNSAVDKNTLEAGFWN